MFLRATISAILLLSGMGCAPIWRINHSNLQRTSNQINRPFTEEEDGYWNRAFEGRTQRLPKMIGTWILSESSIAILQQSNPDKIDFLHGVCFRYVFTNGNGDKCLVLQYQNPFRLHYDEIAVGQFGYVLYHYPKELIFDDENGQLFQCGKWLPFENSYQPRDKELLQTSTHSVLIGYVGPNWKIHRGRNEAMNLPEYSFILPFQNSKWRQQLYGELWLVSGPSKSDATQISKALWGSSK